jgi:hypothetical protein
MSESRDLQSPHRMQTVVTPAGPHGRGTQPLCRRYRCGRSDAPVRPDDRPTDLRTSTRAPPLRARATACGARPARCGRDLLRQSMLEDVFYIAGGRLLIDELSYLQVR